MTGSVHEITPHFGFTLPEFDVNTWHDAIWQNFRLIDTVLNTVYSISQFKGLWDNSIELVVNDKIVDGNTGNIYVVSASHTTPSAPTTFAEFLAAYPTYYIVYEPVSAAMSWATASGTISLASGTSYSYSAKSFAIGTSDDFLSADWNHTDTEGFFDKRSSLYYSRLAYTSMVSAEGYAIDAETSKTNAFASSTSANAYMLQTQTYMNNALEYKNLALLAATNLNVTVSESTSSSYKLAITQSNGSIIVTPNLIGAKGSNGESMTPLGLYATLGALETAHPTPTAGECYSVGSTAPYDIYTYDIDHSTWVNQGPIQGADGAAGADGFAPTIVVKSVDPYVLTITTGATSYDTPNLKGIDGTNGADGAAGANGVSASVSVTTNDTDNYVLSVVSASGTIVTPNLLGDRNPLYTKDYAFSGATLNLSSSYGLYSTTVATDTAFVFDKTSIDATKTLTFEMMIERTAGAITWPTNVKWGDAGAPSLTYEGLYIISFRYVPSLDIYIGVYGGFFSHA